MPLIEICPTCGRAGRLDKTAEQRNKFHALCRKIGLETGNTPSEIKTAIKLYHFGMDEFRVKDKWYRGIRSSEDTDRVEYSELVEAAYRFAAENGVAIDT